jgi:hypothetical protein
VTADASDVLRSPLGRWAALLDLDDEGRAAKVRAEYARWGGSLAQVDSEVDPEDASVRLCRFFELNAGLPPIAVGGAWWPVELLRAWPGPG